MKADIVLHQRRVAFGDAHQKQAAPVQGLLVVFTGDGNGKSGAAFNMAWRAIANKTKVGVVQFFGGSLNCADYQHLSKNSLCDFQIFGNSCSWRREDHPNDNAVVGIAWREAVRMINDPAYGMVILDDITVLIKHRYLDLDTVMPVLRKRRPDLHIVIAGRYAPFELTDIADIVTEMRQIKHPHPARKIPPQAGIEF
jgi:cob(I)alamin adenosyltransferase